MPLNMPMGRLPNPPPRPPVPRNPYPGFTESRQTALGIPPFELMKFRARYGDAVYRSLLYPDYRRTLPGANEPLFDFERPSRLPPRLRQPWPTNVGAQGFRPPLGTRGHMTFNPFARLDPSQIQDLRKNAAFWRVLRALSG